MPPGHQFEYRWNPLRRRAAGANGLMRTDIVNLFGRNLPANKIDAALLVLLNNGKVRRVSQKKPTGGRSIETWLADEG